MTSQFTDVATWLSSLKADTVPEKLRSLTPTFPPWCSIAAVGGFPVTTQDGVLSWCGSPISEERVKTEALQGLGFSGMLTYLNKSERTYHELGEKCHRLEHKWAYNWINLSVLFVGYGIEAELAFTRDTRFFMSWPVTQSLGVVFVATASLKHWAKFLAHRSDPDFDEDAQAAMASAAHLLEFIL